MGPMGMRLKPSPETPNAPPRFAPYAIVQSPRDTGRVIGELEEVCQALQRGGALGAAGLLSSSFVNPSVAA
jgi:hypothetical protein